MDVLKFINSDAIRKHLKEINYQFNAIEAIWLINHAKDYSFDERKKAYHDIVNSFADKSYMNSFGGNEYDSVHQIIIEYVALIEKIYKEIKNNDDSSFYKVIIKYPNHPQEDVKTVFKKYDDAIKHINANKNDYYLSHIHYKDIQVPIIFSGVEIHKRKFGTEECIAAIELNSKLEFDKVLYSDGLDERSFEIVFDFIDSMWFKFPVPFNKGDILVDKYRDKNTNYCCSGPFVLDKMCHDVYDDKPGWDGTDMTAYGYFLRKDGTVYYECMHNYMNLEYYNEPIEEEKRTLITISNYMNKKIDLGIALNAYNYIITDEHAKKLKKQTWYTKAGYIDSGMEKDPNIHIKIWLDDERPAPDGYVHCHSVNEVISKITQCEYERVYIDLLDLDHDLGEYAKDGGDGIKLVDWLAETKKFYPIKLHTMNPVGRENMQREIDRYWNKNEK